MFRFEQMGGLEGTKHVQNVALSSCVQKFPCIQKVESPMLFDNIIHDGTDGTDGICRPAGPEGI